MKVSAADLRQILAQLGLDVAADTVVLSLLADPDSPERWDSAVRQFVARGTLTNYQASALRAHSPENPLLLGDYIVLDRVGRGGMGVVYRARHRTMDRIVAIKLLRPELLTDARAAERFERECRAVARLSHPNIVLAFDAGQEAGRHYLVMEFLQGIVLSEKVRRDGSLPQRQALEFVIQVAQGLEHMHARGVVHRDIKPSNLMLMPAGEIKILDVGLAQLLAANVDGVAGTETLSNRSDLGEVFGTIDYMSPEQAFHPSLVDHRSDLYGLGCTLYYLLTGRAVYCGETPLARLTAHRDEPIPVLRNSLLEVSEEIERIFQQLVQKKPADRYPDATALLTELKQCVARLDSESIKGEALTTKVDADLSTSARHRFSIVASIACMACALTVWLTFGPRPQAPLANGPSDPRHAGVANPLLQRVGPRNGGQQPDVHRAQPADEIDRAVAQWALLKGASLIVEEGGRSIRVQPGDRLPSQPLRLTSIQLTSTGLIPGPMLQQLLKLQNLETFWSQGLKLPQKDWLRLGELSSLRSLNLFGAELTDADLQFVSRLKRLEILHLSYTPVSDAGLEHIRGLRGLTELRLTRTAVTDEGLKLLTGLKSLKSLQLDLTTVDGSMFEVLLELPHLTDLVLAKTRVGDAPLAVVAQCEQLRWLDLSGTRITDIGLAVVGQLHGLQRLRLDHTEITSEGLQKLAGLQDLYSLDLTNTGVTDVGLPHLAPLKALRGVSLRETTVTPAAIGRLRLQLPECQIDFE